MLFVLDKIKQTFHVVKTELAIARLLPKPCIFAWHAVYNNEKKYFLLIIALSYLAVLTEVITSLSTEGFKKNAKSGQLARILY